MDSDRRSESLPASQRVLAFVVAIAVTFAMASVGAMNLPGPWYAQLEKPALTPPGWVFGPVWTLLYLLMAVAAGMVWQRVGLRQARVALGLYFIQLALNAAWSWLFFGLHEPGWSLVDIGLLWLAIVATIAAFSRISVAAAWLLAPYLTWVSFASYLNFMLWRLNA